MKELFRAYKGTEPYIFVSYARRDKDRIFPLLNALHDLGYRIWLDEGGIPLGVMWMRTIAEHIDQAAVCLVFWSEASAVSRHCQAETGEMLAEGKTIVTVFLDETPVEKGLWMYLRQFQAVKLSDFPNSTAFAARLDREEIFTSCKPMVMWNKDGKIQWYIDGDGVLTIAKDSSLQDLTVPMPSYIEDNFTGYGSAPWIPYREKILSVIIRNDIDWIGRYAFNSCSNLMRVTIGNGVTAIGNWAFDHCSRLTSVTIPDSVTRIGDWAFCGCTRLAQVEIPDSVTFIGEFAFRDCSGLVSIEIPNSVTIGPGAFEGCSSLTYVTIPDNVIAITGSAFEGCSSLTGVTIPDSVTIINGCAFKGCSRLTYVEIPAEARYEESGNYASFPPHTQIVRRPPYGA